MGLTCRACGDSGMTNYKYLPEEFPIRLNERKGAKQTSFYKPKLPRYNGYAINSIIQFDESNKHFRCLRFYGRDLSIIYEMGTNKRYKEWKRDKN